MTAAPDTVRLMRSIDRIDRVIRDETAALAGGARDIDFVALNRLKSLGLLELTRLGREIARDGIGEHEIAAITRLRAALDENAAALQMRIRAMSEITGMLTSSLRVADSDGTYNRPG